MAEIVTILQVVSRATRLALSLYHFGATAAAATNDVNRLAKRITEVAVALKQVGASIKDDDSIPSGEATETIQEITHQCLVVFREVETLIPLDQGRDSVNGPANGPDAFKDWKWGLASKARMEYLLEHLESLKMTLLVMLQTFYTVKVMRWSRQQTTYTLERTAEAVDNEKMQLQALIMEQQMVLLKAADLHDEYERSESFSPRQRKLLTEWEDLGSTTSSASPTDETSPLALVKYQEPSLASLESTPPHAECLSKVHGASSSHLDDVIERWTRLREIEERLLKIELDMQTQKDEERWERRQNQQPTVESDDSDDELANLPGFRRKIPLVAEPSPYGPSGIHRTFSGGAQLFPGPPGDRFGNLGASNMSQSPRYPISPASSIKSGYSPVSSFDGTAPAAAAAAAAATLHDDDDSSDLEIPWRLRTRNNYWEYVDAKVVKTNTEAPPSQAYNDRNAWTEILASWVCKESLEESRFEYAQVQKERREGKKTRFEKGFVIHQALTFAQVEALVERTIELLNQNLGRSRTESTDGEGKSSQAYLGVKGGQGQKNHQQHQPKLDRSLSSPPTSAPAVQQFTPVPASPIQIQPQQNPYASGTFSVPASPLQYQPPNMPQGYSYPSPQGQMPVPAGAPGSPFYPTYLDPSMANRGGRPISRHLSMQDANGRERGAGAGAGFYGGPVSPVNSTHASDEDEAARKERRRRREREREEKDRERDRDRDRDRERDRTRDRDRDRDRERDRDRDKDRDRNRDGSKYDSGRKALGTLAKVGALTALLDGL